MRRHHPRVHHFQLLEQEGPAADVGQGLEGEGGPDEGHNRLDYSPNLFFGEVGLACFSALNFVSHCHAVPFVINHDCGFSLQELEAEAIGEGQLLAGGHSAFDFGS
jgi:hypothetical protein